MIRGLYTAASGMVANVLRQQATTNNLANLSTVGYKEDTPVATALPQMPIADPRGADRWPLVPWLPSIGNLGTGTIISGVETNLEQGILKQTGNPFDFALNGTAFFVVQADDGQTYYTRNGSWMRDATGRLVTADGYRVMGERGPIVLPEGDISVSEDGTVIVGGNVVDQLRLVDFPDGTTLEKIGHSLFAPVDASAQPIRGQGSTVHQGYLEASNVDEIRSMVEMLSALRAYEAQQRALKLQDQALGLAVSELGRV